MIEARGFIEAARQQGFQLYSGVPCSYLKPFINYVIGAPGLQYVGATNEGDAVAIASGAELGGRRSVVMFQNSGLGNAVNPLTSLNQIARIPVLVIVTWRAEPGGEPDEPQHALMGEITTGMLDLMKIPWSSFPETEDAIEATLARAVAVMKGERRPYALVMRKDAVAPHPLEKGPVARPVDTTPPELAVWPEVRQPRSAYLAAVQESVRPTDVVVATTGYTGRELYALGDRPGQIYMVGSMGCASSFGLGLALAQPRRRIIVLDGDGAALMRLGALATIGYERPTNLVHVLLDNEVHDSTGGQSTVSHSVDLAAVARACGYPRVLRIATPDALAALLRDNRSPEEAGLTFAHVKTQPGTMAKLPRPRVTPVDVAEKLRLWLAGT